MYGPARNIRYKIIVEEAWAKYSTIFEPLSRFPGGPKPGYSDVDNG
jgi:hypothetical protein